MSLIINLYEFKHVDITHAESGDSARVQVRNARNGPRILPGAMLYFEDESRRFVIRRAGFNGPTPAAMPKRVESGLKLARSMLERGETREAIKLIDSMIQ